MGQTLLHFPQAAQFSFLTALICIPGRCKIPRNFIPNIINGAIQQK